VSFSSDKSLQSNQLPLSIEFPSVKREFDEVLSLSYKRTADAVNTKVGGLFFLQEQATFKQLYVTDNPQSSRFVYRTVFDLVKLNAGNIGAAATVTFPHGISSLTNTMLIYASCTSTDHKFFTVVYPDVYLDSTNVNFTNPLLVQLTQCIVIAEYTKN